MTYEEIRQALLKVQEDLGKLIDEEDRQPRREHVAAIDPDVAIGFLEDAMGQIEEALGDVGMADKWSALS